MTRDPSSLDRRDFIKTTTAAAGAGIIAASTGAAPLFAMSRSPSANVRIGVIGLNGRGVVHAQNIARMADADLAYICDVDSAVLAKSAASVARANPNSAPNHVADFRRILDDKTVDGVIIATPDHWHAPMTILAVKAGKHVFIEKPSGNTPREDELIVAAATKYQRHVQLGTQRRSGPHFFDLRAQLSAGVIGTPYLARTWYANTRVGIGKGKPVPTPAHLDYELWQGPAPRTPYRDNIIHYNWHWFRQWGTGEICNNGTHEVDVARWMLGVDYPTSVVSTGSRFHFQDDWEFPDTQEATWEFEGGKMIVWHGQSCNGLQTHGRSRGTIVLGTTGSVVVDQDGYAIYDERSRVTKRHIVSEGSDALNTSGDDVLTVAHTKNWLDAIRSGAKLNAPISDGAITGMLCHLGTIAQQTGRKLRTDPVNGHIIGDKDAAKKWGRDYAKGWEPSV